MTKIESVVTWAIGIADDNSHGYSQQNRWGNPDYDCSSLVISAWEQAGVPVKTKGATYTGNMLNVFLSCGFKNVTSSVNLSSGSGIVRGDVLLNVANHTAMSIGSGKIVHARSSEGNSLSGDQSGNEIRTQSYWNYPWDYVLRYSESSISTTTTGGKTTVSNAQTIYNGLRNAGVTHAGACGILGNLEAESALSSTNLENTYETRLGYTDTSYTAAVDNGTYSGFIRDSAGYGLAQWTYWSRKQGLLNYAKSQNKSIGDLNMQVEYLIKELKSDFTSVWKTVTTTNSVQDASNAMLLNFERPANATSQKTSRYNLSMKYNTLSTTGTTTTTTTTNTIINTTTTVKKVTVSAPELSYGSTGECVMRLQKFLNALGYNCGTPDTEFGPNTLAAVKKFQNANNLTADGIVGKNTWQAIIGG